MDQKQNDSLGEIVTVETVGFSLPMERIKEVAHVDSIATPNQQMLKLTPWSPEDVIDHAAFLAVHWFNTPLVNPLLFVKNNYWRMVAVIDKYQLDHQDAFFEQYSRLIIQSDGEESWLSKGTSYLRVHYRRLASRLAHYYLHYYNANCMWIASVANACIFANVQGTGKYANFGRALRLSSLKTCNVRFAFFPKIVGMVDYFLQYTKFAVGSTNYGATFISVPYWRNDVYGSAGQKAPSLSDIAAAWNATGDAVVRWDTNANDYESIMALYNHCAAVHKMYGCQCVGDNNRHNNYISDQLDATGEKTALPTTPKLENGSHLVIDVTTNKMPTGVATANFNLGQNGHGIPHSNEYVVQGDGEVIENDNIINRIWDDMMWYQEYVETYCPEMSQPQSQICRFAVDTLKLVEDPQKTMDFVTFFNNVNTNGTFDAKSLREYMIYKKDNKVNTSTWIKWTPILDKESHNWKGIFFDDNFDRYPVYEEDTIAVLRKAKEWPSIAPTVFMSNVSNPESRGKVAPFIANSTAGAGYLIDPDHEYSFPARAILGKEATFLDLACSAGVQNDYNLIETASLDPDDAKAFFDADDALVFTELPDSTHAMYQPLIDCTDIYQCGFNLLIADDVKTKSEVEKWFMDSVNYAMLEGDDQTAGYDLPSDARIVTGSLPQPTSPAFKALSIHPGYNTFSRAHVSNPVYMKEIKHALIFVGDNIWYHPTQWASRRAAGLPADVMDLNGIDQAFNELFSDVNAAAAMLPVNPGNVTQEGDDVLGNVLECLCMAAMTYDPKHLPENFASEYDTLKAVFVALFDKDKGTFKQFVFNPEYGAVAPVVYATPDLDFIQTLAPQREAGVNYDNDDASILSLAPAAKMVGSCIINGAIHQYTDGLSTPKVVYDPLVTPALYYLWFITKIFFKKVILKGHTFRSPEDRVILTPFFSKSKAMLMAVSRGRVEYTGAEDTTSFYGASASLKEIDLPQFSSAKSIDYGKLIAPPKVRVNKRDVRHINPAQAAGEFTTRAQNALGGNNGSNKENTEGTTRQDTAKEGNYHKTGSSKGNRQRNKRKNGRKSNGKTENRGSQEPKTSSAGVIGKDGLASNDPNTPQNYTGATSGVSDSNPNAPASIQNV